MIRYTEVMCDTRITRRDAPIMEVTGSIVDLALRQREIRQETRQLLLQIRRDTDASLAAIEQQIHQLAKKVHAPVAYLVGANSRGDRMRIRLACTMQMNLSDVPLRKGECIGAYSPCLDFKACQRHFRAWMRSQGLKPRRGYYRLSFDQIDEFVATPIDAGHGEISEWTPVDVE